MKNKKIKRFLIITMLCFVLAGCGDKKEEPKDEPVQETTLSPAKLYNPLGFTQFEYNENDDASGQSDAVTVIASLKKDTMLTDKYMSELKIYKYNSTDIVVGYTLCDIKPYEAFYMDDEQQYNYEWHLAHIDATTMKVDKDEILRTEDIGYVTVNGDYLWVDNLVDNGISMTGYSMNFDSELSIDVKDVYAGSLSSDNKKYYYENDNTIYEYDIESKEARKIDIKSNVIVLSVGGVYTDDNGNYSIVACVMAGDFKDYRAIVNASDGEVVYLGEDEDAYTYTSDNTIIKYTSVDNKNNYTMYLGNDKAYNFTTKQELMYVDTYVLDNGDLLISNIQDNIINLELFDANTYAKKGGTSFTIPKNEIVTQEEDYEDNSCYIVCKPVYTEENEILIEAADNDYNTYFYKWYIGNMADDSDFIIATEYNIPDKRIVDIDNEKDMSNYIPKECDEKLQPLRSKADELEKEYDVEIHIGEECGNIIGNYAIDTLTDYDTVEESLDSLEYQLEKYPDNFFSQFKYSSYDGLDIYIAGSLTSISEGEDILEVAGGFQTDYENKNLMVIDCSDASNVECINHELFHSIENKMRNTFNEDGEECFSDDKWLELNPQEINNGDIYTYSYNESVSVDLEQYIYSYQYGVDTSNTYVIDDYAMTYPSEDRARLFENVMTDMEWVDWDNSPHLKEKMDYLAKCIRETFDTTGWNDVMWELPQ